VKRASLCPGGRGKKKAGHFSAISNVQERTKVAPTGGSPLPSPRGEGEKRNFFALLAERPGDAGITTRRKGEEGERDGDSNAPISSFSTKSEKERREETDKLNRAYPSFRDEREEREKKDELRPGTARFRSGGKNLLLRRRERKTRTGRYYHAGRKEG